MAIPYGALNAGVITGISRAHRSKMLNTNELDEMPIGSRIRGHDLGFVGHKSGRPFHKLGCTACGNTRWMEYRGKLLQPKMCGPCSKLRSKLEFRLMPRAIVRPS